MSETYACLYMSLHECMATDAYMLKLARGTEVSTLLFIVDEQLKNTNGKQMWVPLIHVHEQCTPNCCLPQAWKNHC